MRSVIVFPDPVIERVSASLISSARGAQYLALIVFPRIISRLQIDRDITITHGLFIGFRHRFLLFFCGYLFHFRFFAALLRFEVCGLIFLAIFLNGRIKQLSPLLKKPLFLFPGKIPVTGPSLELGDSVRVGRIGVEERVFFRENAFIDHFPEGNTRGDVFLEAKILPETFRFLPCCRRQDIGCKLPCDHHAAMPCGADVVDAGRDRITMLHLTPKRCLGLVLPSSALVCLKGIGFLFRQLRKRIVRSVYRCLCRSGFSLYRVVTLLRTLSPLRFCPVFKVFLGRFAVVEGAEIRGIDGVNGIVGWIQGVKIDLIARMEHDILADLG